MGWYLVRALPTLLGLLVGFPFSLIGLFKTYDD
jgi:hypothetical protein